MQPVKPQAYLSTPMIFTSLFIEFNYFSLGTDIGCRSRTRSHTVE